MLVAFYEKICYWLQMLVHHIRSLEVSTCIRAELKRILEVLANIFLPLPTYYYIVAIHCGSKLKRFWYYEPLWLKFEYIVDKNEIITIYLQQKLEFSSFFELSLNSFSNFCLKIDHQLMTDRQQMSNVEKN